MPSHRRADGPHSVQSPTQRDHGRDTVTENRTGQQTETDISDSHMRHGMSRAHGAATRNQRVQKTARRYKTHTALASAPSG